MYSASMESYSDSMGGEWDVPSGKRIHIYIYMKIIMRRVGKLMKTQWPFSSQLCCITRGDPLITAANI